MGRLFTVNFNFKNKDHIALVCTSHQEGTTLYKIRLQDPALRQVIPEEDLVYNDLRMKDEKNFKDNFTSELVQSITNAVEHHLTHSS